MPDVQFDIVDSRDKEAFIAQLNGKLNEGWELHGDLKAFPIPELRDQQNDVRYIQGVKKNLVQQAGVGRTEVTSQDSRELSSTGRPEITLPGI